MRSVAIAIIATPAVEEDDFILIPFCYCLNSERVVYCFKTMSLRFRFALFRFFFDASATAFRGRTFFSVNALPFSLNAGVSVLTETQIQL